MKNFVVKSLENYKNTIVYCQPSDRYMIMKMTKYIRVLKNIVTYTKQMIVGFTIAVIIK